jgi:hypothetical protein
VLSSALVTRGSSLSHCIGQVWCDQASILWAGWCLLRTAQAVGAAALMLGWRGHLSACASWLMEDPVGFLCLCLLSLIRTCTSPRPRCHTQEHTCLRPLMSPAGLCQAAQHGGSAGAVCSRGAPCISSESCVQGVPDLELAQVNI